MLPIEEAVIKILGKTELASPGVNQNKLRSILEEVLYQYNIQPQSTEIALINDIREKIAYYLSIKQLDGLSKKTINHYKDRLLKFAAAIAKDINEITVMDTRLYLANISKNNNWKNTTLKTEISILKSFFGWLVDNGLINKSPMSMIKQPKTDKRLRKSLTQEELERLRDGCTTARQKALLEFAYSTGCRVSEISNVNINDLNWSERSLKVIGKGNKERLVYFSPKAKLYLNKYLEERTYQKADALFISSKKPYGRLGVRSLQSEVDKMAKQAAIDKSVYPHLIRHTMATLGFKAGASLTTIQYLLGHSDPSTTQIYAEIDADTVREEYKKHLIQ